MKKIFFVFIALIGLLSVPCGGYSSSTADSLVYLKQLSLENLMRVEVTSVSKKTERVMDTAAAIYVLSHDEIVRSGYRSLPELLRKVPGLFVATVDSSNAVVTSRGFKNVFSNKLLVLIDGRSVYTPLHSGVYWDVQDVLIDDIERIEVIRGPGASTWGANAVNGVINVITKKSTETLGTLVNAGVGSHEPLMLNGRYGGILSDGFTYRLYAKKHDLDPLENNGTSKAVGNSEMEHGGFRFDYEINQDHDLTVQGDIYRSESNKIIRLSTTDVRDHISRVETEGGNLLARWNTKLSPDSELTVQGYYDRTERDDLLLGDVRQTWDLDVSHQFKLGSAQDVVWGGGYRYSRDKSMDGLVTYLTESSRDDELYNLFLQDQFSLCDDQLLLTVGVKYEHNDYTGSEWQPNIRAAWKFNSRHTLWGAASRAVRTPSRAEADIFSVIGSIPSMVTSSDVGIPGPIFDVPAVANITIVGNDSYGSERLLAYELGYRGQWSDRLYVDMSLYYNDYSRLRTQEPRGAVVEFDGSTVRVELPFYIDNLAEGEGYGFEVWARYEANDWWSITASYSWLKLLIHSDGSKLDPLGESAEEDDPEHNISIHSAMNLSDSITLDTFIYYTAQTNEGEVPSFWRFDLRLAWQLTEQLQWSVQGANLFDSAHLEMPTLYGSRPSQVPRTVYTQLSWKY